MDIPLPETAAENPHLHIQLIIMSERVHHRQAAEAGREGFHRQGEARQGQAQHAVQGADAQREAAHRNAADDEDRVLSSWRRQNRHGEKIVAR